MWGRRLTYVGVLLASLVFYWAYREWLSFLLLAVVLGLPWLSLALSLPAILSCRGRVQCPRILETGDRAAVSWQGYSNWPLPQIRGKLRIQHRWTGRVWRLLSEDDLPTEACGTLDITIHKPRIYDYLGLFRLPMGRGLGDRVLVRPRPVAPERPPNLERLQVTAWKPRPGGGNSENHELRLYRPGDSLRQVHWKLSAKTGKLILREPMEPLGRRVILPLELRGDRPDDLLGRMRWLSAHLLEREIPHEIHCLTGDGMTVLPVSAPEDMLRALDSLLQLPLAAADQHPIYPRGAYRVDIQP